MKNESSYNDKQLQHIFPNWYTILYAVVCGFLIPWTILLAYILPPHYVSHHWDIAWVGFDAFEVILFALTSYLAFTRSTWTAVTSAMLGTTLLTDAWFDVLTSRTDRAFTTSVVEAFFEVTLAILSFILAYRVFNYVRKKAFH